MKRIKHAGLFIYQKKFLFIVILIIGFILYFVLRPKPEKPISTQKISRGTLTQTVAISGKVSAKKIVDLTFPIGGTLAYLGVKQGDTVSQYQTIATLDQRTAQKNVQAALIDYSTKRNNFDQTQDNNQNRTPVQALNDAMKRILQNNQNDLDKSVNSVELQDLARQQSILSTPIAGIVTRADAKSAGMTINPTTTFEVVDPTSLVFDLDVDEADIGKITDGQQVTINLDAFPDETIKQSVAEIDFVSHTTTTGSNVYTVETELSDPAHKFRVGMNGNAEIKTGEKKNILIVPISALVDNKYVYVKKGDKYAKQEVSLGIQNDTNTEVTKGLHEGDEIALDPTLVQDEKKVK